MRLINFTFDSSIELGFEGRRRCLDLHNCFEWRAITYLSEERRIRLSWNGYPRKLTKAERKEFAFKSDSIQTESPLNLILEFRGVSRFAATPRDSELPYTEDSCLERVTFTPPEHASDFESEFEGYRSESEHITFLYRSGFGLKIWAEEVELIYSQGA